MKPIRIHILQHVAFEGPAAIADWAAIQGHVVTSTHFFTKGAVLPPLESLDWLVIMGGPMGVHDVNEYPWLISEFDYVKKSLDAGKKVVGICLGAQILAHVLGGKVMRNIHKEIGWFPVRTSLTLPQKWLQALPPEFVAFHWHGETFHLPEGALALCESDACKNQGFLWKDQALALQFHLESTPASTEALLANASSDLSISEPYVQTAELIRDGARQHCVRLNRLLDHLLKSFSA